MSDIIVGIGNRILSDDGIGIYIVQRLKNELKDVEIRETSVSGLGLVEIITGFQRAILIDAIKTGQNRIGDVRIYKLKDFESHLPFSYHSTDFISAIRISKSYGINIPEQIFFIGIEIKDNLTFSETFTRDIDNLKETIYNRVKKEVFTLLKREPDMIYKN